MRLFGIDVAKSPRIVPGSASAGFVAPIVFAHRRDRALALDDERPRRRGGDERDELAEERLLAVLGVVLLAELRVDAEELAADDGEATPLDPGENLRPPARARSRPA